MCSSKGVFIRKINNIVKMELIKYSEKLIVWLHRQNKTQKWLADELNQTRQGISQKIKDNNFNSFDKSKIASLGFKG